VVFLSLWVNTYGVILFYEGVILFQFERELLGLTLSVRAAVFASLIASVQFAGGISKIGIVFGKYLSPLSYELHSIRIRTNSQCSSAPRLDRPVFESK
jgi:hypothetical protein